MRIEKTLRRLIVLLLGCAWAASARAELVIFTHGSFLKVEAYEVEGDRVRLELPKGGAIAVSLLQVERIVADEVPSAVPAPDPPAAFEVGFDTSQPRPDTRYGDLIYDAARRHALNPALVAAVVRAESAFEPTAVSVKGAQGLMQLMPATARRFGLDGGEIFEPARNLDAGARYLRWLVDRFEGDLPLVLAAYNAGEGAVASYRGVPPFRETHDYLRRIYAALGLPASQLPRTASGDDAGPAPAHSGGG